MRPVLVLFLLVGTTGILSAEETPKSSESDLARAYYQATKANEFGKANAAFQELTKRFPDDALTQLVADHRNRRTKEAGEKNWTELRSKRIRNRDQEKLVTSVYQIADLIVPVVANGKSGPETTRNAKVFTKIVADTMKRIAKQEGSLKEGTEVTYHAKTLSLVIRAPESLHPKLEELLTQMRRQQDLQSAYDIRIVSIPPEIANSWALQETLSPTEFKKRMELAEKSDQFEVMMSPKLTTFNGQIARISTDFSSISLHGRISEDRRSTRMEIMLGIGGEAGIPYWIISASDTILDGHTGVFFVRSEDAPSRELDRRLLIEKGIDVAPSTANQLFALITPTIIIAEEEEELLGVVEESRTSTKNPSGRQQIQSWPSYGSAYPTPPQLDFRKHPTLKWDDGNWNLNFDAPNKDRQGEVDAREYPWAHPPIPSRPAHATFPSLPASPRPLYSSTCASMPAEHFENQKNPKLNMDDWNWEPNLDAVNKNAQRVIDAWELEGTPLRFRNRKEAEDPLLMITR